MVKIYKQPFAHDGDTIAIPDASQPDGKMSSADGWTPDYQLPKTDPNYKPVGRQEMNGVFKEVTEALGELQQFGFAKWQPITWPQGARVVDGGIVYRALTRTSQQPPHADWVADMDATSEPTPNTIMLRDEAGCTRVEDPVHDKDVVNKRYMDFGVSMSLTQNGYIALPTWLGGLILQWGKLTSVALNQTYHQVTFPIEFPTAAHNVSATIGLAATISGSISPAVRSLTTTGAEIAGDHDTHPGTGDIYWLAIGN